MTPEKRLELAARMAGLVREQIEQNGGRYDGGRMVPNLQSVIDLATVGDEQLVGIEDRIAQREIELGLRAADSR